MLYRGNHGTTLVELMVAVVISSIVAIGFSSVLMFTRNMYRDTNLRSQMSQDAYVVDQYVRKKLTSQVADSLQIFASESDEDNGITSLSGPILRAVRTNNTVDHVAVTNQYLVWTIDTLAHNPIDSQIDLLTFTESSGYSKKMLTVNLRMIVDSDSLELEWLVTIRN